jgi:hypothetical protein
MPDSIDEHRSAEPSDPSPRPFYDDIRDDYDENFGRDWTPREIARGKLRGPATAFIVLGIMGVLAAIIGLAAVVIQQYSQAIGNSERLAIMILCVVLIGLGAALFTFVLYAGINMFHLRQRRLVLVAAFLMTGLAVGGLYAILFFPFGIWALIVLFQANVRREFR